MKKRVLLLIMGGLALAALMAGCGGLKESDVAYADDMVENMLQGLNDSDYAIFSQDFSDAQKTAIDEASFVTLTDTISSMIGSYESKSFAQAANTTQDDVTYTVVVYKSRFSNEEADVLVTVSFSGEEGSKKIEGLFFNSPKLRGE